MIKKSPLALYRNKMKSLAPNAQLDSGKTWGLGVDAAPRGTVGLRAPSATRETTTFCVVVAPGGTPAILASPNESKSNSKKI